MATPIVPSSEKFCRKCGEIKPTSEFYPRRGVQSGVGVAAHCKACEKARVAARMETPAGRQAAREACRRFQERQRQDPAARAAVNARALAYWRERQQGKPQTEKQKARQLLASAVRFGKIDKPNSCQQCATELPKSKIHAHHEDYSRPLAVVWLCSKCHGLRACKDAEPLPAHVRPIDPGPVVADLRKKISAEKASEIKSLLAAGGLSQRKIAAACGVTHNIVACIANGTTWKYI